MKHKNTAYIDTSALADNYRVICGKSSGAEVIAVVKADAYGHGIACAAKVLGNAGCSFFAVSSEEEALELRCIESENGRHPSIILLGHILPENAWTMAEHDILCTAVSYDNAVLLERVMAGSPHKLTVHIKLDTGMNRVGFPTDDASYETTIRQIREIAEFENLRIGGIFTHFSCADTDLTGSDTGYTVRQLDRYNRIVDALSASGVRVGIRHASNSAAILGLPSAHFDAVRAGIILYGISPSGDKNEALHAGLKPVMKLCSRVAHIHKVPAGDKISYGGTCTAETERTVAVIAAGYADGYARAFCGCPVKIGHRTYPSVGRICMDQFMVDITGHEPEIGVGQEVTLFGGDDGELLETLASAAGTISYEILCGISKRVIRTEV